MDRFLEGKAIVITGAGRGIGRETAMLAASLGAKVVVNDLAEDFAERTTRDIEAAGGVAVPHRADVSVWSEAARLVDSCVECFGRIDGLVNNAGVFRMGTLAETEQADVDLMLRVNVMGSVACARRAVEHMCEAGGGSIVNIVSGSHAGIRAMGAYGASKGAMASFTYAWANETDETQVRVNAVSPMGNTGMTEAANAYRRERGLAEWTTGPSAEVNAPVICYLLSDLSSAVNGQVVRIGGDGLSLMNHPTILPPVIQMEDATVDCVAAAFRSELSSRQRAIGLAIDGSLRVP